MMSFLALIEGFVLMLNGLQVMLKVKQFLLLSVLQLPLDDLIVHTLDMLTELLSVLMFARLLQLEGGSIPFGVEALLSKILVVVLMVLFLGLAHASLVGITQVLHLNAVVLLLKFRMNLESLHMALHVLNFLDSLLLTFSVPPLAVLHLHVK